VPLHLIRHLPGIGGGQLHDGLEPERLKAGYDGLVPFTGTAGAGVDED
jgi:hypothetical protein